MKRSTEHGMRTFDQYLFDLYKQQIISYDDALHSADSPNDLRLMIKLDQKEGGALDSDDLNSAMSGVAMVDDEGMRR
jgi:twitching motility protein PilU